MYIETENMALEEVEGWHYSPELVEKLSLSQTQYHALTHRFSEMRLEKVVQIIGLDAEEIQVWLSNPFFRVCWHIRSDIDNFINLLQPVQAGFLASLGVPYPQIEKVLGLDVFTLKEWSVCDDEDDEDDVALNGKAFRAAENALRNIKREIILYGMSDKQLLAVPHVLAGKSDQVVADLVGVCRSTISDWKRHRDFKLLLRLERERLYEANRQRLATLFEKACEKTSELMDSDDEKIALRASLGVLQTLKGVALSVSPETPKAPGKPSASLPDLLKMLT